MKKKPMLTVTLISCFMVIVSCQTATHNLVKSVKKTSPAVVLINTTREMSTIEFNQYKLLFNARDQKNVKPIDIPIRQGSGFIIEEDGYVITNYHVIKDWENIVVKTIVVKTKDGTEREAEFIGGDEYTDIALLKIEGEKFPFLKMGDSGALEVGENIFTIGAPSEHAQSVTRGIISAIGGKTRTSNYVDFIQFDAVIHSGNSGGPLINMRGKVIGINTGTLSQRIGYFEIPISGIGFAIPISLVKNILKSLKENGRVIRGCIGVKIRDLGMLIGEEPNTGVYVTEAEKDGPALKAGIMTGDIIILVDSKKVKNSIELLRAMGPKPIGKKVEVTVLRNGNKKTFSVITVEKPDSEVSPE